MSATTSNSIRDLTGLPLDVVLTLTEVVREREEHWGATEELLAQTHELLQLIRVEQLAGIGVKRHNLPDVRPIPRPGDPPPRDNVVTPGEFARLMLTGVAGGR